MYCSTLCSKLDIAEVLTLLLFKGFLFCEGKISLKFSFTCNFVNDSLEY